MPRISPVTPTAKPVVTGLTTPDAPPADPESAESATAARADRPFLVYVEDPAATGEKFDAIEKVLLQDERVAYGSRAFTAVRMGPDEAAADPLLAKSGKAAPRFIVVAADYSSATSLEGSNLSAGAVWNAMKATSDKFFAKSLDASVRDFRDTILDLDKVEGERKILEEKKTRVALKGSEAEQKALEAKLTALEERRQKIVDRQRAIWDLKPKAA